MLVRVLIRLKIWCKHQAIFSHFLPVKILMHLGSTICVTFHDVPLLKYNEMYIDAFVMEHEVSSLFSAIFCPFIYRVAMNIDLQKKRSPKILVGTKCE